MNGSQFVILLMIFGSITSLITQVVKSELDNRGKKYSSNVVASFVGAVIGIFGTFCFYTFEGIPYTPTNALAMVLMGGAVALGAMVGYDKIKGIINQMNQIQ